MRHGADSLIRGRRPLSALRPLPRSRWLPLAALGLLAGQALADSAAGVALAVAALLATPALLRWHRSRGTVALLLLLPALLGVAQAERQRTARERHSAHEASAPEEIGGRIAAVRWTAPRGGATSAALDVVVAADTPSLRRGERLRLTIWDPRRRWRVGEGIAVRLEPRPPRGFCNAGEDGYAAFLWRSGVVATAKLPDDRGAGATPRTTDVTPDALVADARDAIVAALQRAVAGDAERGVLRALLIGDQSAIPDATRRAYARTGTAHVLSVSGLHIALVAMTVYAVAAWVLARWPWLALRVLVVRVAACAALPPALAYTVLSGGAVATLRSLAMAAIALGAVVLLRRADAWTALAAAALLLAAADPGVGGEPSFQLSFASVAALLLAGGHLQRRLAAAPQRWLDRARWRGRAAVVVLGALVASLAAGAATAPLTALHFGSVSLIGPLANLVAVPVVGWLALLLGLAGVAVLPVVAPLADALLSVAGAVLRPANDLVERLANVPWAAVDVALASPLAVVILLALAVVLARLWSGSRRRALAVAMLLLAAALLAELRCAAAGVLRVRFLDVGQGDASLVTLPRGGALLVDGGGLGGSFDPGERVVVPALRRAGARRLDALLLSHPDHDHHGGLAAVVRAVSVDEFWSAGQASRSASYAALERALDESGVRRRSLASGATPWPAPDELDVRVLHPAAGAQTWSRNDASLVVRVAYGATRVLFTGDVESAGEAELRRHGASVAATVVKVPHHGSRTSSTRELLATSRPALAVALLGWRNRFGFPAPEVERRYGALGAAWLDTGRDGEVVVSSDGQLEQVTTCR